jgi:hypothetical protein
MTRVCAWCDKEMGTTAGPAQEVTHGICWPCMFRQSPRAALRYALKLAGEKAQALRLGTLRRRIVLFLYWREDQPGVLLLLSVVTAGLFIYAGLLAWYLFGGWPFGR